MLPQNIDRYHSLIDLKSQEDYGIHCRDLYILYHNVQQIPPTQFGEIQHRYDDYVRMVVTFNQNLSILQAMEYQKDVKIVESIIMKGNFGKKGYDTLKPTTDFNKFFQKQPFPKYGLKVEDKRRLHQVYMTKYRELQGEKNRSRQESIDEIKRKVYDTYLVNVQHDTKILDSNTIRNFIRKEAPEFLDHINSLYNDYHTEFDRIQRKKIQEFERPIPIKLKDNEILRYPFRTKFEKFTHS